MNNSDTPKKVSDAILAPSPLTMAQVVMLERLENKVLYGDIGNTMDNLKAMYMLSLPLKDAVAKLKEGKEEIEASAILWAEGLNADEYRSRLTDVANAVDAFWAMIPRPDEDSKKAEGFASETVG